MIILAFRFAAAKTRNRHRLTARVALLLQVFVPIDFAACVTLFEHVASIALTYFVTNKFSRDKLEQHLGATLIKSMTKGVRLIMFVIRNKLALTNALIVTAALLVGIGGTKSTLAQITVREPTDRSKIGKPLLNARKFAETQCAACHGIDGNSTDAQYPKIAGQNPYYIRLQLRAFKSGARRSDVMSGIASTLSESQIGRLARYFSNQPVTPDVVKDRQLAAIGTRIFRYPGAGVPPCIACHGGGGYGPGFGHGGMMGGRGGMMGGHMGMMMGYSGVVPNLYGQHADYIIRQLAAFATGKRRSSVMGPIAGAWREQEHRAVAEYLSGVR